MLPWIEEKRSEIQLPDQMIHQRLAEIHAWLGDLLLNAGDAPQARLHLRKSLGYQRCQPTAWKALALACLPESVRGGLRTAFRELKLRLRARKAKTPFCHEVRMKRTIWNTGTNTEQRLLSWGRLDGQHAEFSGNNEFRTRFASLAAVFLKRATCT